MTKSKTLHTTAGEVKAKVYDKCAFEISKVQNDLEGKVYEACQFEINGKKIISRSAKITPKKVGQFVTFWKRNREGITVPYTVAEQVDFYVINVRNGNQLGQFVFPRFELIKKGIMTTEHKDGKRGFRVYPEWDEAQNIQARKTQEWQLKYFYRIDSTIDFKRVAELYSTR